MSPMDGRSMEGMSETDGISLDIATSVDGGISSSMAGVSAGAGGSGSGSGGSCVGARILVLD